MKPKIVLIQNTKQGSINPEALNLKARFQWALQLAIKFGLYNKLQIRLRLKNYKTNTYLGLSDDDPIPTKYDPDNLTAIKFEQVVTWDKVHQKVITGSDNNETAVTLYKMHAMKFPRNKNGKLNLVNVTYSDSTVD